MKLNKAARARMHRIHQTKSAAPAADRVVNVAVDRAIKTSAVRMGQTALLLFGSGACALAYQMTWLRELLLVFGGSTHASAAVLAIFMAGLGLGSAWLGPRADRKPWPLRWYGQLELGIALSAAASIGLLILVRAGYIALGGSPTLGPLLATVARIVLATLVIGVPALLMGGTLPAVARSVETSGGRGRRALAWLYGINTLGAVTGAMFVTFYLLEHFGARATLLATAGVNMVVGIAALRLGRSIHSRGPDLEIVRGAAREDASSRADAGQAEDAAPRPDNARPMPRRFVLAAAGFVGFAFFMMELVWYRMLAPLLGGTTFTFGMILAVALLGIGLGSALYALTLRGRRPTLAWLGATCIFEALGLAIPFALGDRLAVVAMVLRPLGQFHFAGLVVGWAVIAMIVVLPAALAAGFQFPVLIALLGDGVKRVGADTGSAYAWNTAGAILGSLAGGFVLIPLLSAPGLWRLAAALLAIFGTAALALHHRRGGSSWGPKSLAALAGLAIVLVFVPRGPTSAWRHSGIGAGREDPDKFKTRNQLERLVRNYRASTIFETDGRESPIAILDDTGLSLIVGGKSDGNLINDAGTQIMVGLLGAYLHPAPKNALVIGLGTGSTAGWLGLVPSIQRVEAVEMEPAVMEMVRLSESGNGDPIHNPKVHISFGDGREHLLTTRSRYDVIASEPSNPYRAGVASLYSREFYRAAATRLTENGMFLQWLQAYDISPATLKTVYATMCAVFPNVETWATLPGDLVLVASMKPVPHDVPSLRRRLAEEPFRSGIGNAWRTADIEGVVARHIGSHHLSQQLARGAPLNTDDRTVLEYAFARNLGTDARVELDDLYKLGFSTGAGAAWTGGILDAHRVVHARATSLVLKQAYPPMPPEDSPYRPKIMLMWTYLRSDYAQALTHVRLDPVNRNDLTEVAIVADVLAEAGDPAARQAIEWLRVQRPVEADFLLARLLLQSDDIAGATDAYERACLAYRRDPWVWPLLAARVLPVAQMIARKDTPGEYSRRLYRALEAPFAGHAANYRRMIVRLNVAGRLDDGVPGKHMREVIETIGDDSFRWEEDLLEARAACFKNLGDPRAARARLDLERFRRDESPKLVEEAF